MQSFRFVYTFILFLSSLGFANCDYCEWGGLQATGGYNLFNFGLNLYSGLDYSYGSSGYDSWGGSCGTLISSCGGGYSAPGLYGNNWGPYSGGGDYAFLIDIQISPIASGSCGGYNSGCGGNIDVGCGVGYCSPSGSTWVPDIPNPFLTPNMPFPGSPMLPPYGGGPTYPPFSQSPFPPYSQPPYAGPTFPPYPPTGGIPGPGYPSNPLPSPPRYIPPYGGCDDIFVPCPRGPVGRNNPPGYPPPSTGPQSPNYPPRVEVIPVNPDRGKVPRGIVHGIER